MLDIRSRTPLDGNWFTPPRYLLNVSEGALKFRIGSNVFTFARFARATQQISLSIGNSQAQVTSEHFASAYNSGPSDDDRKSQELKHMGDYVFTHGTPVVWAGRRPHPKQDLKVQGLAGTLPVTTVAVGTAFDFISQTVQQAFKWMQGAVLEWSYRLVKKPRRLTRRYFLENPQSIRSVVRNRP